MSARTDHEYAGIDGVPAFRDAALQLAYGRESAPLGDARVAAAQVRVERGSAVATQRSD